MPGAFFPLLAKGLHWAWGQLLALVSPLASLYQRMVNWFRGPRLGAKAVERSGGPVAPSSAAVTRPEGPCIAASGRQPARTAEGQPQSALAQRLSALLFARPAPAPEETREAESADAWELPVTTSQAAAEDRDAAVLWHDVGAELAAGLGSLHNDPSLDPKATNYVKGLQRLLPMMEGAEPRLRALAAGSAWSPPPRQGRWEVLLQSVLPVLDNLYRGQQALASEKSPSPVLGKLRTLCDQLYGRLEQLLWAWGVRQSVPLGQPFDPREQEAVVRVQDPEALRGQVLAVYVPGYWLGTQLLRPAQVAVVC